MEHWIFDGRFFQIVHGIYLKFAFSRRNQNQNEGLKDTKEKKIGRKAKERLK